MGSKLKSLEITVIEKRKVLGGSGELMSRLLGKGCELTRSVQSKEQNNNN